MIVFDYADTLPDFRLPFPEDIVDKWIKECFSRHGFDNVDLYYYFTDDKEIVEINQRVFNRDYPTDVISLTYPGVVQGAVSGQIYISVDTVKDNATRFDTDFPNELLRVMIHGALHIMGYDDATDEQKVHIRALEDECLREFRNFASL